MDNNARYQRDSQRYDDKQKGESARAREERDAQTY